MHPEAEMSRYLTAQRLRQRAAAARRGRAHRPTTASAASLAVAQGFVRNQGDAWTWTLDQLQPRARRSRDARGRRRERAPTRSPTTTAIAAAIGRRLGEMHAVLARPTDDPAFAPETAARPRTSKAGSTRARALLDRALRRSMRHDCTGRRDASRRRRSACCRSSEALDAARCGGWRRRASAPLMTRIHGDFHLGQVLVAQRRRLHHRLRGRAGRPLAERRAKASPLRDVAGLLRSFDYAAAATLDPKNADRGAPCPTEQRDAFITRLRDGAQRAFLDAYRAAIGDVPAGRRRPARLLPDREGRLRTRLRGGQPAGLAADPAARPGRGWPARILRRRGAAHERARRDQAVAPLDRARDRGARACAARRSVPRARPARHARRAASSAPSCPAPTRVEVLRRADRARARPARARASRTACSQGRVSERVALPAAHHLARRPCRRPRTPIPSARCSAISTCICSTRAAISSSPMRSAPM